MADDDLLTMYDAQLRGMPEMVDAPEVVAIGAVLAAVFPARRRGFVTYPPLSTTGPQLDSLVGDVMAYYTADPRVDHVTWKTRGHDSMPRLLDLLQRHGFTAGETETVLAGTVDALIAADPGVPEGYGIERARSEAALQDAEGLACRVFGDSPERTRQQQDELVERWRRAPDTFEMWAVRDGDDHVVCSGRIDFVDGSDFAGLWGGACHPGHRGRGLYRALVARRARSARAVGKHLVQVDCSEHSRPILERAGLIPITTVTAAVWKRP